ncbi:MAG: DEAD/DEAH box helicase [Candidatus Caenarcaniphilales bacterium]|nr:DEAD/DEAH box helicase [Candidatus Caenarcaniphilales bacterium]
MPQNSPDPNLLFPFPLDEFQLKACEALRHGKNVLVCAPTGAGKTMIAEYAIHVAIAQRKRIFYTTPLKALSNQKYFDLSAQWGSDRVGLLTGDTQLNRDGEILVLTTEIFRNMLYKSDQEKALFERIGFLILDECHYLKDPDRGTVWEECVIYCPAQAQIIGLSATVGNPRQLASWIDHIHGETELIESKTRPVPLRFLFYGHDGLKPLLTAQGKLNKALLKAPLRGKRNTKYLPSMTQLIAELKDQKMLPVIYFLFSRKGCEAALQRMLSADFSLLSVEEEKQVNQELYELSGQLDWLKDHPHFQALRRGIAAHHAGLLPSLKGVVERLFQKNLIKIVFATETLAAGINMPARSVVISQISKRADTSHRLLLPSEFLQMGGRAGRRGMDEVGYVVVLESAYEGPLEAGNLALSEPDDLHSAFTPSYVMVLNLAARCRWDKCQELVLQSFANYEAEPERKALRTQIKQLKSLPKKSADQRLKRVLNKLDLLEKMPWSLFQQAALVLKHFDYLDNQFQPTEQGVWAADLRCDNILLLAEIIRLEMMDKLTPYELAAFVCGLTSYDLRWNANQGSGYALTDMVDHIVRQTQILIKKLSQEQSDFGVMTRLPFNPSLIEIGFDWACAYEWLELIQKYQADEGDLVKMLKQASDILKQISLSGGASFDLRSNASHAFKLLYRSPIRDDLNWE